MADEIKEILETYHVRTLWEMAQAADIEGIPSAGRRLPKKKLLPKMRVEFFTRARVRNSLEKLNRRERAVLDRLLLRGGSASTKAFRREIVRAGLASEMEEFQHGRSSGGAYPPSTPYAEGLVGNPHRKQNRTFEDLVASLTYHGLVFSRGAPLNTGGTPYKLQFHPASVIYVPHVIRRHLPEPDPLPSRLSEWEPSRVESGTPTLLLRDLYLYWDFVRRNDVDLVQSGFVGKRGMRAINQTLLSPDPLLDDARREDETGRLYLLRQLLEALGLVFRESSCLRPTEEDPLHVPEFWHLSPTEQLRRCLEAWPLLKGQNELRRESDKYAVNISNARRMVLETLKHQPSGTWLEIEQLLEQTQARDRDFLFPEYAQIESYRGSWYYSRIGGGYYGSPQSTLQEFERLEYRFVHACLTGFLHQTGVVELGYDGKALQAYRLSQAGQAILGEETAEGQGASADAPPAYLTDAGKIIIQPNFHIIAMGPVDLALLARLDLFAERQQVDQAAFEYRLSRESIYQAQQLGLEARRMIAFLERAGDVPLPQNVERSLKEWAARHERIIFRSGLSLVQVADVDLLRSLMDDPQLGEHFARSVSDDVAVVRNGQHEALTSALVARGIFPAVSGASPVAADNSVTIDPDGSIELIHAVPNLHLQGRLSRVAEKTADGWRLTPRSVRRAGGSKERALRLLGELDRLHRGPLPEDLVAKIKAWGRYYGDAATETVTLIEFRDRMTLQELSARPELASYLTPFVAGERALAVVSAEDLPRVREVLNQLGVEVQEGLRR
ncbi:MAG: helicase-associated domain-containing protein [Anaerolineae bacterium]|jgi:hypothetical protein